MNDIEQIWTDARRRYGHPKDRRLPSAGIAAVLGALLDHGPAHGCLLAVRASQDQGNLAGLWLPKLRDWGFVMLAYEMPGEGHQGGGRAAHIWALTPAGRRLATALDQAKGAELT